MSVDEDGLRAEPVGRAKRHGGMYAELARSIRRGRDHAALIGLSTDHHGLAFERRIEELFDGDEEGVHVDVEVGLHGKPIPSLKYDRGRRIPMNKMTILIAFVAALAGGVISRYAAPAPVHAQQAQTPAPVELRAQRFALVSPRWSVVATFVVG